MLQCMNMWFVYMVHCADNTLYTGVTNNILRRLEEHNKSNRIGSKYVRARRPVRLVFKEKMKTRSQALRREAEIKKLSREVKVMIIKNYSK